MRETGSFEATALRAAAEAGADIPEDNVVEC
jgi:hypothetical protein